MTTTFNIYCDESCHLAHDHVNLMGLGALWCPSDRVPRYLWKLRKLKRQHGFSPLMEIKWSRVSPARLDFYLDVVRFFFSEEDLHFRAVIAHRKDKLVHGEFRQTHDDWYFKMYFLLLREIISPQGAYHVFMDVKDTRSAPKIRKLWEVLCNNALDFQREIIKHVQTVSSDQVALLQVADLLLGTVVYASRRLTSSPAKLRLVDEIRNLSGYRMTHSTLPSERKLNLFHWTPREQS